MKVVELSDFRARLGRASNPIALCGAGLSIPGPTALPSGDQLRDLIIETILCDDENAVHFDKLFRSSAYRALLPEAALQEIGYFVQPTVDRFIAKLLNSAPPNPLHAAVAQRFDRVFTTNFDQCFERVNCREVFHLHGSISRPQSLQTRLWRLGRTAGSELGQLGHDIQTRTLFVSGYSLRDSDILNTLRSCSSLKILFLSHTPHLPAALGSLNGRITCAVGSLSDLWRVPVEASGVPARTAPKVRKPSLANKVQAILFLFETCGLADEVEAIFRLYRARLGGRARLRSSAILAETLRTAQRFNDAKALCEEILEGPGSKAPKNLDLSSWVLTLLALCAHEGDGNPVVARGHLLKALVAINSFGRDHRTPAERDRVEVWRAKVANNLGNVERDRGRYRRAECLFRFSLSVKLRFSEEAAAAQTLVNLAVLKIMQGDLRAACLMLDDVIVTLRKAPEHYICRSAVFDVAIALGKAFGYPSSLLRFDDLEIEALADFIEAQPVRKRHVKQLITRLRNLDSIRKAIL